MPWTLAHFLAEDAPPTSCAFTVPPLESYTSLRTSCSFEWRMVCRNQDLTLSVLTATGYHCLQVHLVDRLEHKFMTIVTPLLRYWKLCIQTNIFGSNPICFMVDLHSGGFFLRVLKLITIISYFTSVCCWLPGFHSEFKSGSSWLGNYFNIPCVFPDRFLEIHSLLLIFMLVVVLCFQVIYQISDIWKAKKLMASKGKLKNQNWKQ